MKITSQLVVEEQIKNDETIEALIERRESLAELARTFRADGGIYDLALLGRGKQFADAILEMDREIEKAYRQVDGKIGRLHGALDQLIA